MMYHSRVVTGTGATRIYRGRSGTSDYEVICEVPYGKAAHAAFIVRACNSFDELLAALKRICNPNAECTCHDLGIGGGLCDVCQGRATIAKAERQP